MADHYSGHDPARGCGCMMVLVFVLVAWVIVVLAIIGAIEVGRRLVA